MKGFIEVTTQPEPQTKLLINVNQIIYVGSEEDNHARIVIGQDVRTDIALLVTATYDEVKALIAEAQGETEPDTGLPEPEPMLSKLEEWKDTFKVLRDIKGECAKREVCGNCIFRGASGRCIFKGGAPCVDWEI